MTDRRLSVIGGGLAGSEAAWQAAKRGVGVRLFEMRPTLNTPAHHSGLLAELVCSNSLRSADIKNAVGLLKAEMRLLGSIVMEAADKTSVPAGSALAVDRELFAGYITAAIERHPLIEVVREEVTALPESPAIVATGPLTSEAMARSLGSITGTEHLHFYDAIAPIVDAESIDMSVAFRASRYGKGGDDYINCPMDKEHYDTFYDALMAAEKVPVRDFESMNCFEGCMPIEIMAERGRDTLRHGPMKPMGITDPRTGRWPYAVVQLRTENAAMSAYNIVGFQTRLKWPEQERVFRMIPGLGHAEFLRLGSLHRNTFINSPLFIDEALQLKSRTGLFVAGQVSGVEGYVESAAMGLLAGINASAVIKGRAPIPPPSVTAHGALVAHLTKTEPSRFQPSNIIFSLFPPLEINVRQKEQRRQMLADRALAAIVDWKGKTDGQLSA